MAGKRQHYIMRLLLNGFASRTNGDQTFTWCFRRNTPPFEPNTVNVGVEGNFYGKSGEGSLDDFITNDLENTHQSCIQRLRENPPVISSTDRETLIDCVHSLVLRPKHFRQTMAKGAQAFLEHTQATFTDVEVARRYYLNELKADTSVGDNILTQFVRMKYGSQPSQREKFLKWKSKPKLKQWLLHRPEAEENLKQLTASVKAQLPPLFEQIGPLAQTSHNDSLKTVLQSGDTKERPPRYLRYLQMHWRVHPLESGSLILGDVPVLQFERRTKQFSVATDGIEGDMVFLPLSHNLLIIGSGESVETLPSAHEVNYHSAALSIEYFVSSQHTEQEKAYHEILGSQALKFPQVFGQEEHDT